MQGGERWDGAALRWAGQDGAGWGCAQLGTGGRGVGGEGREGGVAKAFISYLFECFLAITLAAWLPQFGCM